MTLLRLLGAVLLVLASSAFASAASATEVMSINAKALTSHSCDDSEWHFVITGLSDDVSAPDSITATWDTGASASVALEGVTGGTAHYRTTANLSATVTAATAQVATGWNGQFNLSHGPCGSSEDSGGGGGAGGGDTSGGDDETAVTAQAPTVTETCERGGVVVTIAATGHVTYKLNDELAAAGEHFVAADATGAYSVVVTADADSGYSLEGKRSWDLSSTLDCAGDGDGSGASTISAKSLTDYECNDSEWHFVITGLADAAQAPQSIAVSFTGGVTAQVSLEKVTGGTAHYRTTDHLELAVVSATAQISGDWDGQFNLSHGPCEGDGDDEELPTEVTATTPSVAPHCSTDSVTVTIPATAHVTYSLNGSVVTATETEVAADSDGDYIVVVTAHAETGYTLVGKSRWDLSGSLDCEAEDTDVVAAAPTVTESCAQGAAVVVIPSTAHVTYSLNGSGVAGGQYLVPADDEGHYEVVVHATAGAGYVLSGTAHWDLSDTLDCDETSTDVSAETPVVVVDCQAGGVVVTIPATAHVSYRLNGTAVAAGPHTVAADDAGAYLAVVTAQADAGYTLVGTSTFSFSGTLGCGTPGPSAGNVEVTVTQQPCTTGGAAAIAHIAVPAGAATTAYTVSSSVADAAATPVGTVNLPAGAVRTADVTVPLVEDTPVRITVATASTTLSDATLTADCSAATSAAPAGSGTSGGGATGGTSGGGSTETAGTAAGGTAAGGTETAGTAAGGAEVQDTKASRQAGEESGVLGTRYGSTGPGSGVSGVLAATGSAIPGPVLVALGAGLVLLGLTLVVAPRAFSAVTRHGRHHR